MVKRDRPLTEREMKHQIELVKIPRTQRMSYDRAGSGGGVDIFSKIIPILIIVGIAYLLITNLDPFYLVAAAIMFTTVFLLTQRVPFVTIFTVDLMIIGLVIILALKLDLVMSSLLLAVMMIIGYYISTKELTMADLSKQNWIIIVGVSIMAIGGTMILVPSFGDAITNVGQPKYAVEVTTIVDSGWDVQEKVRSIEIIPRKEMSPICIESQPFLIWGGGDLRLTLTGDGVNLVKHKDVDSSLTSSTDITQFTCLNPGSYNLCGSYSGTTPICRTVTVG